MKFVERNFFIRIPIFLLFHQLMTVTIVYFSLSSSSFTFGIFGNLIIQEIIILYLLTILFSLNSIFWFRILFAHSLRPSNSSFLQDLNLFLKANIRRDLMLVGYFSVIAAFSITIILNFSSAFYYDYIVLLVALIIPLFSYWVVWNNTSINKPVLTA
jgi:hypothetical protein